MRLSEISASKVKAINSSMKLLDLIHLGPEGADEDVLKGVLKTSEMELLYNGKPLNDSSIDTLFTSDDVQNSDVMTKEKHKELEQNARYIETKEAFYDPSSKKLYATVEYGLGPPKSHSSTWQFIKFTCMFEPAKPFVNKRTYIRASQRPDTSKMLDLRKVLPS